MVRGGLIYAAVSVAVLVSGGCTVRPLHHEGSMMLLAVVLPSHPARCRPSLCHARTEWCRCGTRSVDHPHTHRTCLCTDGAGSSQRQTSHHRAHAHTDVHV